MKSKLLNNLRYKILAVVLAFILWAVVVNITDPTITVSVSGIPITIENEDAVLDGTKVYTVVSGDTASITITGSRSNVYKVMKSSAYVATADFSEVSITNTVEVTVEFSDDYSEYKNLVSINEESSMTIQTESLDTQDFDLEVETTGTAADGFEYSDITIDPETVTITAPESVIATIGSVVVPVDISGATSDLYEDVTPVVYNTAGEVMDWDEYNISLDVDTVNVSAGVIESKSIPLSISSSGTVADGYLLSDITLSLESVTIKGTPDVIDGITSIDLGTVDLDGATSSIEEDIDISALLPDGVTLVKESESTVTVYVDIEEPTTTTLTLSSDYISLENLSSDYTASINSSVSITLTGLQDLLDEITESSLAAYVDLSTATAGTAYYNLEMTLPDGVTSSTATVSITLTENETTTSEEN